MLECFFGAQDRFLRLPEQLRKDLQTSGEERESGKRPTPVVDRKPIEKCQIEPQARSRKTELIMSNANYLSWLSEATQTCWWHDSADPRELVRGVERGAVGATTNPFLCQVALAANRQLWAEQIREVMAAATDAEDRAERLMRIPVTNAVRTLLPQSLVRSPAQFGGSRKFRRDSSTS